MKFSNKRGIYVPLLVKLTGHDNSTADIMVHMYVHHCFYGALYVPLLLLYSYIYICIYSTADYMYVCMYLWPSLIANT